MLGDVGGEPRDIFGKYVLLRHFLRVTAVLLTFVMAGEIIPAPLYAAAGSAAKEFVTGKAAIAKQQIHSYEVMQDLKGKMAAVKPADFVKLSKAAAPPMGTTIIDEIGRLSRPLPSAAPAEWRVELHKQPSVSMKSSAQADYFAQRHLWLGEYLLAKDQAPREAAQQFRAAYHLTANNDKYHGQAVYDLGLAVYYEHNFRASVHYYRHMLQMRPEPAGLNRPSASLMLHYAMACFGYHQGNARLGIPEPPVLDPLCGAAALAASLKTLGVAYDAHTVLAQCNPTEEGSELQDLIGAAHKLGAAAYSVTADDEGLRLMPKPAIAFIEEDHFVSVVRADKKGIAYLCSDCGSWPGGEVDLTWKQWHHMEPGIYGVIVRHGSNWDQFFRQLPALKANATVRAGRPMLTEASSKFMPGQEVASLTTNTDLRLASVMSQLLPTSELIAHLAIFGDGTRQTACGAQQDAPHCILPCDACKKHCSPGGGGSSGGGGGNGSGGVGGSTGGFGSGGGIGPAEPLAPDVATGGCNGPGHGGPGHSGGGSGGAGPGGSGPGGPTHPVATPLVGGASSGDPVNLSTGEEEYTPDVDLTVYNPIGPAVSWGRLYNSLRSPNYETWYEFQDFGEGWSTNYNIGVNDPSNGGSGSTASKYIYMPNGGRILFTAPSVPTAATPVVQCQVQIGYAYLVSWNYNSSNGTTYYVITDPDRTKYVTSPLSASTLCSVLTQIIDRNGNSINFNYSAPVPEYYYNQSWPLLSSITDSNGSPLLVINRAQDGTGAITSVDDRYGRTVYYHVGYYENYGEPPTSPQHVYDCDHVSQIEPTDTANPPDRYHYGYTMEGNGEGPQLLAKLTSISVPNPTGSTTPATAYIAYNSTDGAVTSLTDANGNETTFESVDQYGNPSTGTNYEKVTVTGANMPQPYSYTVSYNGSMAALTGTDGAGNIVGSVVYGDANNPYSPTTETDGNGNVWTYTYTPNGIGAVASTLTPRGTSYAFTWNYSNFGLGELTQEQESYRNGGATTYKAPLSYTYYEPSGLVQTVTKPMPGTVDSSSEVTFQYTYNSLGGLTQVVGPGNNAASSITNTLSYGATPHIGEVLTATDNLGHSTTFTYDSQANTTSITDALGNTTYFGTTAGTGGYNIANQSVLVTSPATGQTGTGNSYETTTYQYPGGPESSVQAFDESGNQIRQVTELYGSEGEPLTIQGSTQFATYSYDALYRLHTVTDGNAHITTGYYNVQGYIDSVTYPGYAGPTPVYNTTTGTWSNVAGTDSVRAASYDHAGDILTQVDGRGVDTTYTYADPENQLTNVSYNVTGTGVAAQPSASLAYDGFGRLATVSNGVTESLYGYTSGSTSYPGYDDNDSPLNVETAFYNGGSLLFTKSVNYTYNPDGSKAATVTPAGTFTYAYDGGQRLDSITNSFSETTTWSYLNNNWLSGQTLANGGTATYTYNAKALVTQLVNRDGGGNILSNFSGMTYDGVGDRTALTAEVSSDTSYSGTTNYIYDAKDELTNETSTRNGGYTNAFAFDGAENPTTFRGTSGKTYNSDSQQTGTGFAYDGNGNPTTYKGTSLTFDVENRLTSVGTALAAVYGVDSRRASSTVSSATTYYLYDGDSASPVCEMNSSGIITATNTYGLAGLISRHTSSGSTFYEFDPQGTVLQRLNSAGSNTVTSTADAFGNIANSGTVSDPFGYEAQVGYYTDQSTGLILTTFRYYDPANGRFLNRDPSGYAGGINVYAYCGNEPTTFSDVTGLGLFTWPIITNFRNWWLTLCIAGTIFCNRKPSRPPTVTSTPVAVKLRVPTKCAGASGSGGDGDGEGGAGEAGGGGASGGVSGGSTGGNNVSYGPVAPISNVPTEGGGACFVAGTPVQMADGSVRCIESVRVGDRVKSRNPITGEDVEEPVERLYVHPTTRIMEIFLSDGETITCTPQHRFFVIEKGFELAGEFMGGERLSCRNKAEKDGAGSSGDHQLVTILSVHREKRAASLAAGTIVYNFSVTSTHTYYVGAVDGGVWVHNDSPAESTE